MSAVKAKLNEFEIKSIINTLKDYKIINIYPVISGTNQVFYAFLFKRGGFVFSYLVRYSSSKYVYTRESVSVYIDIVKKSLDMYFEDIDKELLSPYDCNVAKVDQLRKIYWHFKENSTNLYFCDLIKNRLSGQALRDIQREIKQKSYSGFNNTEVYEYLSDKYHLRYEDIVKKNS